ncbi:MAG: NADH-quinone oxidoreductase subunit J [Gemmataceae bacterium]|nr:NADH-quinone oxidoreductase subunit J [Gemmataceae bacterium]
MNHLVEAISSALSQLQAFLVREWPLWLPLLAGAVAAYLLLPRPRPYPGWMGAGLGLLALVLGGLFLLKPLGLSPETVLFYAFAALAVVAGVMLATQQNPARAALSFTLVVLSTCGLFLLLAAPFLMAATIIVYAGAIIVTFLFVLMLAQQEGKSDADARSREPALAVVTAFLLVGVVLHVVRMAHDTRRLDGLLAQVDRFRASAEPLPEAGSADDPEKATETAMNELGFKDLAPRARASDHLHEDNPLNKTPKERILDTLRAVLLDAKARQGMSRPQTVREPGDDRKLAVLSGFSGTPATAPDAERRRDPATGIPEMPADNAAALGRSLFTDYLLPVELGGFLLLVATVGAIAIAQRKTPAPLLEDKP